MTHPLEKTRDRARGRWREILQRLGVDEKFLRNEHGPCPLCGPNKHPSDRFRFDDKNGDGDWYCNQCGAGTGMRLLMELNRWDFPKAAAEVDKIVGSCAVTPAPRRDDEGALQACRRIWQEARPLVEGDPGWLYLVNRVGQAEPFARRLRLHPALRHMDGGTFPALLAQMASPDGSRCVGLKRIWLTPDGHKAAVEPAKATLGHVGTVRLGPVAERLGIAEGIETACCAALRFNVPTWAADNAHALETWEPPQGVASVLICGDNDESYTGQAAAFALARKLRKAGLVVEVAIPPTTGSDWADLAQAS